MRAYASDYRRYYRSVQANRIKNMTSDLKQAILDGNIATIERLCNEYDNYVVFGVFASSEEWYVAQVEVLTQK